MFLRINLGCAGCNLFYLTTLIFTIYNINETFSSLISGIWFVLLITTCFTSKLDILRFPGCRTGYFMGNKAPSHKRKLKLKLTIRPR